MISGAYYNMLYLVTGVWVEDPSMTIEEFAKLWEQLVHQSLETLSKTFDGNKTGGIYAGQRRGVFILDASSHEEVGSFITNLPFWSHLTWNVEPLQSFRSTIEKDMKAMENLSGKK
ncbi:MAG TPA: hypothetical protein VD694_00260 [Nitrososphaeraceae archaeon]|nr:hypothetical protein [Nitrososphaeraceae archaeon]